MKELYRAHVAERQKQADEALYRELRARYEVVVERPQLQPLTRKVD